MPTRNALQYHDLCEYGVWHCAPVGQSDPTVEPILLMSANSDFEGFVLRQSLVRVLLSFAVQATATANNDIWSAYQDYE